MDFKTEVHTYINDNEPADQDCLEELYGQKGLRAVRDLMIEGRVSYTLEWDLQTEEVP